MNPQAEHYQAQFGALAGTLAGAGLPWLDAQRQGAIARFAETGFPTPKIEDWKYTNLGKLAKIAFGPAPVEPIDPATLPAPLLGSGARRLVFVNGRWQPELSNLDGLPDGVRVAGLAASLAAEPDWIGALLGRIEPAEDAPLVALNGAFAEDGCVIELAPDAVLEAPLEILYLAAPGTTPVSWYPRNLIVAGAGSRVTLVERHLALGPGVYFVNGTTEIVADAGAAISHAKLQQESPEAFHISTALVRLAAGASFESTAIALGAGLSRHEVRVTLAETGARCRLDGAYLARGSQHVDNTTIVDHAAPETASRQLYKGVLDDRARGVFQGRVTVRQDAQKTDGRQANHTLLLSDKAEIDSKPELEIYADDVKCSHGATAGELDENQLFYLRSRGISVDRARGLLIEGFLGEVIDGVEPAALREMLSELARDWLSHVGTESAT